MNFDLNGKKMRRFIKNRIVELISVLIVAASPLLWFLPTMYIFYLMVINDTWLIFVMAGIYGANVLILYILVESKYINTETIAENFLKLN